MTTQTVNTVFGLKHFARPVDKMIFKTLGKDSVLDGYADEYIYLDGDTRDEDGITIIRHKSGAGNFVTLGALTRINISEFVGNVNTQQIEQYVAEAQAARDAALIQAGVYATEAAGRAAVADGQYFKVAGVGNIAAYEYKRINSTTSSLISIYPSKNYVDLKTDALVGKNLCNIYADDVALGYFPSNTTGVLQANASYNTSGYIPVIAGLQYTVSTKHYWAWYDTNKAFISGTSSADTNKTQTAPVGAVYMRCSILASNWNTLQVENGTASTSYEAYGVFLKIAAIKDRSLTREKIALGAIDLAQTTFIKAAKNKFNKNTVIIGSFLGNDNVPVVNATYDYSDFIPVTPSTTYTSSHAMRFTTFFDANYNLVSGGSSTSTTNINVPSNVYYVRVTITHANLAAFQLEQGAVSTVYEPYAYKILGNNSESIVIDASSLVDGSINRTKVDFLPIGKNKFNKDTVTNGYFLGPSGTATASGTYSYSDFIAVNVGTQYTSNTNMRFTCYYDSAFNVVAGGSSVDITTFTVPSGVAYVRITATTASLSALQLEMGSASTGYEAYGYYLKDPLGVSVFVSSQANTSGWKNRRWATLGDSITYQQTWQGYVVSKFGLLFTNFGIGGTKVSGSIGDVNAMCQDTRINAIPTDIDLISVMGGTNDWAQSVALGDVNTSDPTTFYGALNTMVSKLMTRFADKRIMLFTTPYGEMPARITDGNNWINAKTNNQGLTTYDYAEAVRVIAKKWGLPCVDVFHDAGFNTANLTIFMQSDGNYIHPNTEGGKRIAEVVIGKLSQLDLII